MKILYLIRHAKSSWEDSFMNDFDRPLNPRGKKDAPRMGKRLKEREVHPDLLIASPAERALSTCQIIADKIGYPIQGIKTDQRLYHATEDKLLAIVHKFSDGNDEVMVFGHNPGLTDFANGLCEELVTDNIPTCGIVTIQFPVEFWKDISWGKEKVVFFDYPKNL